MPLPLINIVFDIDDTIVAGYNAAATESEAPSLSPASIARLTSFIQRNISIDELHILYPGVIEFIQLIDKMPNVRISFFSAGLKERNHPLVERLLIMALGEQRYSEIKSNVIVCSKEHWETHKGFQVKNLHSILKDDEMLAWAVLIDDDLSRIRSDQIGNILRVNGEFLSSFEDSGLAYSNFFKLNQMFYATGILFTALEMIETRPDIKTLSDALLHLQYDDVNASKDPRKNPYWKMGLTATKNVYYYEHGLMKLKEMNPTLDFYMPDGSLLPLRPPKASDEPKEEVVEKLTQHGIFREPPVTPHLDGKNPAVELSTVTTSY